MLQLPPIEPSPDRLLALTFPTNVLRFFSSFFFFFCHVVCRRREGRASHLPLFLWRLPPSPDGHFYKLTFFICFLVSCSHDWQPTTRVRDSAADPSGRGFHVISSTVCVSIAVLVLFRSNENAVTSAVRMGGKRIRFADHVVQEGEYLSHLQMCG